MAPASPPPSDAPPISVVAIAPAPGRLWRLRVRTAGAGARDIYMSEDMITVLNVQLVAGVTEQIAVIENSAQKGA